MASENAIAGGSIIKRFILSIESISIDGNDVENVYETVAGYKRENYLVQRKTKIY